MPRPDQSFVIAAFMRARLEALACFVCEAETLAYLPHRFAGGHGGGECDVEAAATAFHWNQKARVGVVVDMVRYAGRFAAEEQYVAVSVREVRVGNRGLCRKQHKPAVFAEAPLLKAIEVNMAGEGRHFEIVHAGAPEVAVGDVEAGGLDDVDGDSQAGGEAQDGAGVAGDVGLVERDSNGCQGSARGVSCTTATVVRRQPTSELSRWLSRGNAAIAASLSTRTSGGGYGIHDDRRYPPPHSMGFRLKAESVRRFRHIFQKADRDFRRKPFSVLQGILRCFTDPIADGVIRTFCR